MTSAAFAPIALSLMLGVQPPASIATLRPDTLDAWSRYVLSVERRRASDLSDPARFLFISTGDQRTALLSGATIVEDAAEGADVDVPSGRIHHWRGAVFLPGVTLEQLLARLESEAPPTSPEVIRSSVISRGPQALRVYLRIKRTKIVTAVYDTEHAVQFQRLDRGRATSTSTATKIVELENPGTPDERALPDGDDRGFLWRLNAYWRYQAVPGGVIAECESMSLSRAVPFGLGVVAGPVIRGTARESMTRTLESLRTMMKT